MAEEFNYEAEFDAALKARLSDEPENNQVESESAPPAPVASQEDDHMPPAQDQEDAPPSDDVDELRRKAHGYDSMLGRLERERREKQELEARLYALEHQTPPAPAAPVELSDDVRADMDVIRGFDPALADLVAEASPSGDRLRKALEKFGVETTMTMAETERLSRSVQQVTQMEQARSAQMQTQAMLHHYSTLFEAAPTVGALLTIDRNTLQLVPVPGREAEAEKYFSGLDAWVENLPYKQAVQVQQIRQSGSARDVAAVLKDYEQATMPRESVSREQADMLAPVPSRGARPDMQSGEPQTYEDLFNQAVRDRERQRRP